MQTDYSPLRFPKIKPNSFLGYKTATIEIPPNNLVNHKTKELSLALGDVIVVGYGT